MNSIIIHEFKRKLFHLLILLIPLFYQYVGKKIALITFFSLSSIIILADYYRRKNIKFNQIFLKIFGSIMRDSEKNHQKLSGASFLMIAVCVIFSFFNPKIAIISFIILAISDALAAIIGKSFSSKVFFEKSSIGSLAFGISAYLILVIFGIIFNAKLLYYLIGIFAVFITTIIEARPSIFLLDDNLTVPLSFAFTLTIFNHMWQFI